MVLSRSSDAKRLAERIRTAVEQLDELGAEATPERLLDTADLRLLEAKRLGRNRVCAGD